MYSKDVKNRGIHYDICESFLRYPLAKINRYLIQHYDSIDLHALTNYKKDSFTYIPGRKKSILQVNYPYIIAKTENSLLFLDAVIFRRIVTQVSFEVTLCDNDGTISIKHSFKVN